MFSAGSSSTQRDQRPTATPLKGSEGSSDLVPPAVLKAQEGDKTWRNQGQTATPLKGGEGIADRLVLAARKAQEADQTRRLPHGLVSAATPSERIDDQTRMPEQGRHLYLVFDDWCSGYSIMKVSLSPHSVSGENAVQRLPLPFVRLVAPRGSPKHFVSAFGSWILAMHPRDPVSDKSESYFPMLNVVWQGITFGPGHGLRYSTDRIYLSVGEKLFTLSTTSIEMLCLKENVFPPSVYCSSMDCSLKWSREKLARPPFKVGHVISYALQPDQQTFLVSTNKGGAAATFTFDTVALSWKLLGKWALPFDGRGYFDPYLQSFVGISKDPNTLGQLYMCGLPIGNTGEGQCPAPAKKLFREKLFSQDPAERHVSATLIYMGYQSKFCLVQCLSIEEDSTDQALVKEGDVRLPGRYLYRVTTFIFSGDLKIKDRQVQYYEVPKATTKCFLFEDPVAFWM